MTTTTKDYSAYPNLEDLPRLVKQQRRLVAGTLRIVREEKELRNGPIYQLLEAAGIDAVICDGFEIRRKVDQAGERYATVVRIADDEPRQ